VLELACGTGSFTREIVRHAQTVTAVDASLRMLAINRTCVNDLTVRYVHGDIFAGVPDRTYDVVFFGFWLSNVPPSAFHDFGRSCGSAWHRMGAWRSSMRMIALPGTMMCT
jgi:ubiquinone/menaquinone biosynthesis C-methylase UbiE